MNASLNRISARERPPVLPREPENGCTDVLLQSARRVDWRFLLPDPNLGDVGYLGAINKPLLDALQLFSRSLMVVGALPPAATYDLVVVSQPAHETLRLGAELLRPQGVLYLETGPHPILDKRHFLGRPGEYASTLKRLGFRSVAVHWHWPSFEECTEIIPLDCNGALCCAFRRRGSDWRARGRAALGHVLLRLGLLESVASCVSITARSRFNDRVG